MPKVSVLIPCYNAESYIGEAIDSILRQTLADFEIVVVDDGSTDNSARRVNDFQDARIRLIRLEENRGVAVARNEAMRQARSEYLAFLDADDLSLPGRLAVQADFLDRRPDIDLVGSAYYSLGKLKVWKSPEAHGTIAGEAFFKLPFRMSTVMLRKTCLRKGSISLNPAYRVAEDYDFADQLLAAGSRFANLPQPLVRYRTHPGNTSNLHFHESTDYTREIRRRAVRRWFPQCDERELGLHDAIAARSPALRPEDAPAVAAWLEKLYAAAPLNGISEPDLFLRALARQWDQVCSLFAGNSIYQAACCYFSRPLFYQSAGLPGWLAFLARCLKRRWKKPRRGPGCDQ